MVQGDMSKREVAEIRIMAVVHAAAQRVVIRSSPSMKKVAEHMAKNFADEVELRIDEITNLIEAKE